MHSKHWWFWCRKDLVYSAKDLSKLEPGQVMSAKIPVSNINVCLPDDGLPSLSDWVTTALSFLFSGSRLYREPIDLNIKDVTQPKLDIKKGFTRLFLRLCTSNFCNCLFNVGVQLAQTRFTRFLANYPRTAGLFILLVASDLDPHGAKDFCILSAVCRFVLFCFLIEGWRKNLQNVGIPEELLRPMLPAIVDQFCLPCAISFMVDPEECSFQNIQLSSQGAERQRKDVQYPASKNTLVLCVVTCTSIA